MYCVLTIHRVLTMIICVMY